MTFFGARHVETDGSHVYVCFEDLRDSLNVNNAVRKSDKTWLPAYVKVKKERVSYHLSSVSITSIMLLTVKARHWYRSTR